MFLTVNGVPLFCRLQGPASARPVAFLHGFPFSHEMWLPQLEAMGDSVRSIAYDLRGHGSSHVGDGQYTLEDHVDDLRGILDELAIRRAVVVGLSMGGYVALRALERHPERFSGAVLCDTRSEADSDEGRLRRAEMMRSVKSDGTRPFADAFLRSVFAQESFHRRPDAVRSAREMIERNSPLGIAGTLLALAARTDTTPSLARIRVPVMVLVGEQDALTPYACARDLSDRIPGSELHIIRRAGHLSNLENPGEFNRRLLEFLDRTADRPRGGTGSSPQKTV
ncbi:MAG: alpha/beta fold hydrolase [Bacteroidota bacterium]